jgi:hypothetical protein
MNRALGVARTIGSLVAIELFVPGGTLIVLTLLLTGRSGSPLLQAIGRRFPALSRFLAGVTRSISVPSNVMAHE